MKISCVTPIFTPSQQYVGIFNAGMTRSTKGDIILVARVQTQAHQPGVSDPTKELMIIKLSEDGRSVTPLFRISTEAILNHLHDHAIGSVNIEDARLTTQEDGTIAMGVTFATPQSTPYPGIVIMHDPTQWTDAHTLIISAQLLTGIPAGKNVAVRKNGVLVYREETDGKAFTFSRKQDDGQYAIFKKSSLPEVPWIRGGRFGLTDITPIDKQPDGKFLLIIHGYTVRKTSSGKIYEYALGLACCRECVDGSFDVLSVSLKPILGYRIARRLAHETRKKNTHGAWNEIIEELSPIKRVIYALGAVESVNKKNQRVIAMPITEADRQVSLYHFPLAQLWEHIDRDPRG